MRTAPMILLLAGAVHAWAAAAGEALTLRELEQRVAAAPAVRLAGAELAAAESRRALALAAASPRLFASASASRFADPVRPEQYTVQDVGADGSLVTSTQRLTPEGIAHTRYGALLGVRVPLFGSRELAQRDIDSADSDIELQRWQQELSRMEALKALRYAYVEAWLRPRQERLARAYLDGQAQAQSVLALRTSSHLLQASEQKTIAATWLHARQAAVAAASAAVDARQRLEILSGQPLGDARLAAPAIAAQCVTRAALENAVERHPDMRLHAARLEHRRRLLGAADAGLVEGGISLAHGRVREAGGGAGRSTAVALELSVPLFAGQWRRAQRSHAGAELARAQLLLDTRRQEYLASLPRLFGALEARGAQVRLASAHLDAAHEAHRIASQRLASLDGEPVAGLLHARYKVYAAASELLEAQLALAHARIDVLGYGVDCKPGAAIDPDSDDRDALALLSRPLPALSAGSARAPGWYAWQALRRYAADPAGFWASLPSASRILLSLDRGEVDAVLSDAGRAARLEELLDGAAARAIRVELLLGDPDWALPGQHGNLVELVRSLERFRFAGVHLDLERMQLPPARRAAWAGGIVAAVAKLRAATGLPLALSLHPRDAGIPGLLDRLQAAGLDEVAFMAYNANPARVAAQVEPVLRRHPGLRFSVAQSIEARLSASESYAQLGIEARTEAFDSLAERLRAAPNFAGIIVQSLEDHATGASHED